jgi:hypothetical protein
MTLTKTLLSTLLFLLVGAFHSAHATALYYTFEGIQRDGGCGVHCATPIPGTEFGDTFSYTFLVEDEPQSSVFDGIDGLGIYEYTQSAQLVNGTGLILDDGTTNLGASDNLYSRVGVNPKGQIVQMDFNFFGLALNGSVAIHSYFYPENMPESQISSYEDFTNWAVGNLVSVDNNLLIDNADGGRDSYPAFARLELTSISEVGPSSVPEPSSIVLVAFGLLFMTLFGVPKKLMSR